MEDNFAVMFSVMAAVRCNWGESLCVGAILEWHLSLGEVDDRALIFVQGSQPVTLYLTNNVNLGRYLSNRVLNGGYIY